MDFGLRMVSGLFLALAAFSAPAAAQPTPDQTSAIQSNCRGDFLSKCSGVKRGGIEAFECLKKNEATLSAGCKAAVGAVKPPAGEAPKQAAPAPKPQAAPAVAAPTPPAEPKAPAAAAPKMQQPAKSAEPRPAAKTAKPTEKKEKAKVAAPPPPPAPEPAAPKLSKQEEDALVKRSCVVDYRLHCFGTPLGEGRAIACLQRNAAKLTPACGAAMKVVGSR